MESMTTAEAAEYLRVPVAMMRWWRHEDRGPVTYRLGRRVVYSCADLDRWVKFAKAGHRAWRGRPDR
ncbi:helix-turn-helix domain-containing protein [Mycolicibacterium elephantis]